MRELVAMLKCIDVRRHNEMAVQASFHGIRIPVRGESAPQIEVTEAEASAMERAIKQSQLRKAEEFSKRHG